jgi:predicted metal-binding protein
MTTNPTETPAPVELLVCTTCKRGQPVLEGDDTPGAKLFQALQDKGMPDGVNLRSVECLSNCPRGCSLVLRGGERWTYIYGNFNENDHVDTIIDGATRYQATDDGLVPWRERPEHFRKNCISRIPPWRP